MGYCLLLAIRLSHVQFVEGDYVALDAVNSVYHVRCDGKVVGPTRGLGTFEEINETLGLFIIKYHIKLNNDIGQNLELTL